MSVLGSSLIRQLVEDGVVKSRLPVLGEPVGPASLDVRLHETVLIPLSNIHDPSAPWGPVADINAPPGPEHYLTRRIDEAPFMLKPGCFILAETSEVLTLPDDVACRVYARSSAGRMGLRVCACAGWVDNGFNGSITLELRNDGKWPWRLRAGDVLAQLVFSRVEGVAEGYGVRGRYQGQTGVTPAR